MINLFNNKLISERRMFVAREEKAFAVLVLVEEGRELARKRAVRAPSQWRRSGRRQ